MGLFGSILKTVVEIVEIPVAIVKDTATMGGSLTDKEKPYTQQKIEDVSNDIKKVKEQLEKV